MNTIPRGAFVGCIAALVLAPLAALHAADKPAERVAVLLRNKAWPTLETPINQYLADVQQRLMVRFEVVRRDWKSPEEVRAEIKRLHAEKGIAGVVLIGAMPMHRFFMHEHANPNPLYYEDFDLKFVTENPDGFADAYQGTPRLKVWVGSIRSTETSDDDIEGLKHFFAKAHTYHEGKLSYERRAIVITDTELGGRLDESKLCRDLYGRRKVDILGAGATTLAVVRNAFRQRAYAICTIGVHSDWTGQELVGGELTAKEIASMETGALFTINHGCCTGNWCVSAEEKSGLCTAQSWVFGKGVGLAVVANVRSGCIYGVEEMCKSLRAGEYLGQAYLAAKKAGEQEMHREYPAGNVVSGVLMIGDPFLRFQPIK